MIAQSAFLCSFFVTSLSPRIGSCTAATVVATAAGPVGFGSVDSSGTAPAVGPTFPCCGSGEAALLHRKGEVAKALPPAPDLSCSRRHSRGALYRTRAPEGRSAIRAVCRKHGACRNILTGEAIWPHFSVPGLALISLASCPCQGHSGPTHPLRIEPRAGIVRPKRPEGKTITRINVMQVIAPSHSPMTQL